MARKSKGQPLLVAIVDDEPMVLAATSGFVRSMRYRTAEFSSAETFVEQLKEHPCDIVVTDHDMSGMTGLELMHILRNDPRFEKIPVIVLSATDVRQAVESAGRIFVDKMNPSRLRRALEDAATVARTNILLRD